MSHCAHRREVVLHGEIHVACAYKLSGTTTAFVTLLHRGHNRVLGFERCPPACAEIAVDASRVKEPLGFVVGLPVVGVIVDCFCLAGHDVIELRHYREYLYLEQYRV